MAYGGFSLLRRCVVRPVMILVMLHFEADGALSNTRDVDVDVQLRNVRKLDVV